MVKGHIIRPFLKWPGNKQRLVDTILPVLPAGKRLLEPFVGSGAVFLNSKYKNYVLNDNNPDVINIYLILQQDDSDTFITYAKKFFTTKNNCAEKYYAFRDRFNRSKRKKERAALFIYLNRHGYNGLCRYNSEGKFNVPFGRHDNPGFPEKWLQHFQEVTHKATFTCGDFTKIFAKAKSGDVIYCDPPYVPWSATANFTLYSSGEFGPEQQKQLLQCAKQAADKNIPVIISNHDNAITRELYQDAEIMSFPVQRFITCKGADRNNQVQELLAIYQ